MKLFISDLQSNRMEIEIPEGKTVEDLLSLIWSQYQYETEDCVLFFNKRCLTKDSIISQQTIPPNSLIVLYNKKIYGDPSNLKNPHNTPKNKFSYENRFNDDSSSTDEDYSSTNEDYFLFNENNSQINEENEFDEDLISYDELSDEVPFNFNHFHHYYADFLNDQNTPENSRMNLNHTDIIPGEPPSNTHNSSHQENQQLENELLNNVDFNEEDWANVQELMTSGFNRSTVIQVYYACERNIDQARNVLSQIN